MSVSRRLLQEKSKSNEKKNKLKIDFHVAPFKLFKFSTWFYPRHPTRFNVAKLRFTISSKCYSWLEI